MVMALLTLFTLDLFLPGGLIAGTQPLEQARTACFTVLFNCFNARSETASAFRGLIASGVLWCSELRKALRRAMAHRHRGPDSVQMDI